MSLLPQGIAHMSFPGGGTFVPVRSAVDRHRLIADIANYSGAGDPVQLLVEEQRWVIRRQPGSLARNCIDCGIAAEPAAFAEPDEHTSHCISCVLASGGEPPSSASKDLGVEEVRR